MAGELSERLRGANQQADAAWTALAAAREALVDGREIDAAEALREVADACEGAIAIMARPEPHDSMSERDEDEARLEANGWRL